MNPTKFFVELKRHNGSDLAFSQAVAACFGNSISTIKLAAICGPRVFLRPRSRTYHKLAFEHDGELRTFPTMIPSESAAAATFGLINSIAQLDGLAGPYVIGLLNDRTRSLTASFALVFVASASVILSLKIRDPVQDSEDSKSS
jgi:hypothetical protein